MTNNHRLILSTILTFVFLWNIGNSQIVCNVNVEYKEGYKIQIIDGMGLIYDNKEGFKLFGKLIRVSNIASGSLISVRLIYRINTTEMKNEARGLLRLANSFKKGMDVKFTFKSADGGTITQTLPITDVFDPEWDNTKVAHVCGINIPDESINTFLKKNLEGISIPYYDEYFNVKAVYPKLIIDYYECLLKN